MGDVNLEIKLNNLDDRVIKIEESGGGGSGGDGYITSVSNDFNVVNKKLLLSNDVTTKLSKVDTTDNLSVELAKKIDKPTSATDGQVLTYNGTSNEWEAQDSKGGGDGYITSVSNDFNVVNKKLSLSTDVTTKLSKLNSDGTLDFSNVGSKPTTLSGYGITDAYTKSNTYSKTQVDSKLDSWFNHNGTIVDWTVEPTNTDVMITFSGIDTSKAYELWFDTPDGQQATLKSSSISGTDITYTVNTPTAGTMFRLLVKGI